MDNNNFIKTNRFLFYSSFIATIVYLWWLSAEMFLGKQPVTFEMTIFFITILGSYALHNRTLKSKIKDLQHKDKKGEYFTALIWGYAAIIYTLKQFSFIKKISEQLSISVSGVTLIFFGTAIVKIFFPYLNNNNNNRCEQSSNEIKNEIKNNSG